MNRRYTQYLFLLFNLYIGAVFYLFVRHFETGGAAAAFNRPPSVEAYLPIAALISLKHLLVSGVFDPVHPAGLAIFLAVIVSAATLGRGFCSWICPIGTLSELTHRLGNRVAVNLRPPRFLDIPLRALKYLLLGFFVYAILSMDRTSLRLFIDSPFNRIADVKMLLFFRDPSRLTILVVASFFLLSLVVKNFWCRYLCPYGALLGLLSKTNMIKVERDRGKCVNCHKCEESCPAYIDITKVEKVTSAECIMCTECVSACTETGALSLKVQASKISIKPRVYGALLVGAFFAVIFVAQATGHWQTDISLVEYQQRIPAAADPIYTHP